jgi:hypothetical protein
MIDLKATIWSCEKPADAEFSRPGHPWPQPFHQPAIAPTCVRATTDLKIPVNPSTGLAVRLSTARYRAAPRRCWRAQSPMIWLPANRINTRPIRLLVANRAKYPLCSVPQ